MSGIELRHYRTIDLYAGTDETIVKTLLSSIDAMQHATEAFDKDVKEALMNIYNLSMCQEINCRSSSGFIFSSFMMIQQSSMLMKRAFKKSGAELLAVDIESKETIK